MICPRCQRQVSDTFAYCPFDSEPLHPNGAHGLGALHHERTGLSGAVIGDRFQITGFVNKGATARIYLAEDVEKDREPVIVKLFAPETVQGERARVRFHREAELLKGVHHPNIIKVLSHGEMQGRPYIVTEALRGESLGDYLKREQRMPAYWAVAMMRHAALGLLAAHRAGIVHRDVKPGNLFLMGPVGSPYGLKVIDFGMAKGDGRISAHDIVLGTMEYMAPEQIVSDPVDARTDIYGLGVVMFRVFTGHLPFDVDIDLQVLAHQMFSPAPPPSWLAEEIDPRIERAILRALRKNPENRYASMQMLADDLEQILAESAPEDGASAVPIHDVYEPVTSAGREAIALLSQHFGGLR